MSNKPAPRVGLPRLLWTLLRCRLNFVRAIQTLFAQKRADTLHVRVPGLHFHISRDPELAHRILVDGATRFFKTRWEHRVLKPAMEGGLILLEGEQWKERRQASASCFTAPAISDLVTILRAASDRRMRRWNGAIDIGHEVRCIVSESMLRFFVDGHSPGDARPEELDNYARSFDRVERGLESRVFFQPHHSWGGDLRRVTQEIELGMSKAKCPHASLATLLKKLSSPQAVVQEVRTMVGAGATTRHLAMWICELLARDPRRQERLRGEIVTTLGSDGAFSLSAIEGLPYLTAVIQEALRLYPPAPYLIRKADGVVHMFSVWAMHRNPETWDHPNEFRPERFLSGKTPPGYIPFGLGPRVCVGKRFAMTESRVMLIEALRRFRFTPLPGTRTPEPVFTVLTRPAEEFRLRVAQISTLKDWSQQAPERPTLRSTG